MTIPTRPFETTFLQATEGLKGIADKLTKSSNLHLNNNERTALEAFVKLAEDQQFKSNVINFAATQGKAAKNLQWEIIEIETVCQSLLNGLQNANTKNLGKLLKTVDVTISTPRAPVFAPDVEDIKARRKIGEDLNKLVDLVKANHKGFVKSLGQYWGERSTQNQKLNQLLIQDFSQMSDRDVFNSAHQVLGLVDLGLKQLNQPIDEAVQVNLAKFRLALDTYDTVQETKKFESEKASGDLSRFLQEEIDVVIKDAKSDPVIKDYIKKNKKVINELDEAGNIEGIKQLTKDRKKIVDNTIRVLEEVYTATKKTMPKSMVMHIAVIKAYLRDTDASIDVLYTQAAERLSKTEHPVTNPLSSARMKTLSTQFESDKKAQVRREKYEEAAARLNKTEHPEKKPLSSKLVKEYQQHVEADKRKVEAEKIRQEGCLKIITEFNQVIGKFKHLMSRQNEWGYPDLVEKYEAISKKLNKTLPDQEIIAQADDVIKDMKDLFDSWGFSFQNTVPTYAINKFKKVLENFNKELDKFRKK